VTFAKPTCCITLAVGLAAGVAICAEALKITKQTLSKVMIFFINEILLI
jgi:hypothetical protein